MARGRFGRRKDGRRAATRHDRGPKVFLFATALAATAIFFAMSPEPKALWRARLPAPFPCPYFNLMHLNPPSRDEVIIRSAEFRQVRSRHPQPAGCLCLDLDSMIGADRGPPRQKRAEWR